MTLRADWAYPTQIRFGAGRISELGDACSSAGIMRPLLVTDRGLKDLPIVAQVLQLLKDADLDAGLFAQVEANPHEGNLQAGLEMFRSGDHDGVIAMGGGSALDLGKLIAFMNAQKLSVWDFEDVADWWTRAETESIAPVIAVPTAAGTGSEVGRASVLTNSATHIKKVIFHPRIMPTIAIADPELTVGLPPAITAGTGMDAFCHCLEAYCAPSYHPLSQGIAAEGMRLVKEYLVRAFENGNDLEARAHMMSAACMGAVAFQKGLGAIHALSHPASALYGVHHGTANAVIMPAVLAFNKPVIEDDIVRLAAYLGIEGGFAGFVDYFVRMRTKLCVPDKLGALGVDRQRTQDMASMAAADPCAASNPVELDERKAQILYEQMI